MAKELYVGQILTDEMITVGKQVLQQIETVMPITASFWLYTSEAEEWRLHIVTPIVSTEGPKYRSTYYQVFCRNQKGLCTWDCPYEPSCHVGAILYGCPFMVAPLWLPLYGCPFMVAPSILAYR